MERKSALTLLEPAKTLDDVHKTLSPQPLLTRPEIRAFYRGDINKVRGGDKVCDLAMDLEDSEGASFYKACLAGHPGVGKSTELTRLVEQMSGRFRAIRFLVTEDLDPGSFKPFDVLLLMMALIVEETAKPVSEGGAGKAPSDGLLQEIVDWFAKEEVTLTVSRATGLDASAGVGPPAAGLWQKAIGLFANIKGEMKYASDRSEKLVEYRLQRVSELLKLVNRLLNECSERLRDAVGCDWLFIGEEFDKSQIPVELVEGFFLNYGNVIKETQVHSLFTIPISLVYSERTRQLPYPNERVYILPDTPVFDRDHKPCKEGRAALKEILTARVSADLFERNQMSRLIVASGGNLRDLFGMVERASKSARLRNSPNGKIGKADVDRAVAGLRTAYERSLGIGPFDKAKLTYLEKAERLLAVYHQQADAGVPDPVLYSLLNARAVQEFNGERWFGVHPLVVDILKRQGRLVADSNGKVPGGTE
jgi:hypothetical protein